MRKASSERGDLSYVKAVKRAAISTRQTTNNLGEGKRRSTEENFDPSLQKRERLSNRLFQSKKRLMPLTVEERDRKLAGKNT